ncbi:MAG TPA: amidohydrolase [Candidatus Limnocylindrales bacterium]|nr:amidohydrolase [Candidatus Limnocylindrales bacterium]
MSLLDDARETLPWMVGLRRRIHRHPELGLELPETQALVIQTLEDLGLQPRRGRSLSSVTAIIGADMPGRTVVLRADMDALPLSEDTGLEFASDTDGRMHACGHDTHVAMLLGAARLLVERHRVDPASLPGPVLLMFQPGEEGFFGARVMLEEGLLDGLDLGTTRGFAIHISARYASGEIHTRPGPMQASADNFLITIHGRGGHASTPHLAADPIPVAAEIVLALQSAVTRTVDIFDPAVLTIGRIAAGTTHNVIPEVAYLEGTFRCVSAARRAAMPELIRRVVGGVTAAHGLEAHVRLHEIYPVSMNDADVFEHVRAIAVDLLGDANVETLAAPLMPAEDWSFVLQRIPGVMVDLGARPRDADPEGYPQNHSNRVVFDEAAMAVGAALHAKVALEL